MTAAIESSNKEQEGGHADNGDNEWQAEAVLVGFWWSFPPQHHVTDSRLAEKENLSDRTRSPGLSSPPHPFVSPSGWVLCLLCYHVHSYVPGNQRTLLHQRTLDLGVKDKAAYLSQVIPFVLQPLIDDFRRKLRCGGEGEAADSRAQPRGPRKERAGTQEEEVSRDGSWHHPPGSRLSVRLPPTRRRGSPHPALTLNEDSLHCHCPAL